MPPPKRICLICTEIFAWGKYGGFGKATRMIGRELVKRGYDVFAVVPRREGQEAEEDLDGITVLSFLPSGIYSSADIYRKINADIYHSCEPSIGTWLAKKFVPDATHIVTSRDPKNAKDWLIELAHPSKSRIQVMKNYLYEHSFLVKKAVRNADAVFVPAHFLADKVKRIYHLRSEVRFLPTPTEIPGIVSKSPTPNVLYMGRLDPRKRPELTLSLAKAFPDVTFHIAGKARSPEYSEKLKASYHHQPNVHFLGFVNPFEGSLHTKLLSEAWIHVNTAAREGLPNSFVEAAGHQCAILSHVDPDGFATRFGYHVSSTGFKKGLTELLRNDSWKERGRAGHEYVQQTYAVGPAMDAHEEAYHQVTGRVKK